MAGRSEPNPRNLVRVEGVDRTFHRGRILFVLMLPLFASMLAVSAINVALPTINAGLGATSTDLQWLLAGYALAFGVLQIPAGRLGDVTGRGMWFVVGLAVFTLSSLACALAPDPLVLNAFRLVQGLGAGIFMPQTTGMIQQYFSGGGRAKAFGLFGITVSASVAVGPLLTGTIISLFGERVGWRVSFLVNVPIGLVGIVLALLWFPFETERARRKERGVRPRIDLDPVGAVLVTAAAFSLMWPFMAHGGPATWLVLPVGVVLLWVWVLWERRYLARGGDPMVDLALFRFRSFSVQTGVSALLMLGATSVFVTVALFMQNGLHMSAFATGLIGLPNAVVSAVAAWWSGRHAMAHGRRIVVAGLLSHVVGTLGTLGVIAATAYGLSAWWLLVTLAFGGLGMGLIGSANQTLSMSDVPRHNGGTAGGVKSTAERVATAMGNATMTAVFFSVTAAAGHRTGAVATLAVIATIVGCSLLLASLDLRHERTAAPAGR